MQTIALPMPTMYLYFSFFILIVRNVCKAIINILAFISILL